MKFLLRIVTIVIICFYMRTAYPMDRQNFPSPTSKFGTQASSIDLNKYSRGSLEIPKSETDGKIKTLNAMGFMTPELDHFTKDFVQFAGCSIAPVLDGGAAYGLATIAALKKGSTVIANDVDSKHLLIIANNSQLDRQEKKRLYLNNKALPEKLDLPDNSLGAILLCRVMHFFNEKQMNIMLDKAYRWLIPGGRVYIVVMTPYHYALGDFAKIYNRRWQGGNMWPGIITSMTKDYLPDHIGKIPDFLHVMDINTLAHHVTKKRFLIKKVELFGHHRNKKDNGKGYVGMIAVKEALNEKPTN